MKNYFKIFIATSVILLFGACKKFLSERESSFVTNISTLQDMQQLMDATNIINYEGYSPLMEIVTDDFFIGKAGYDRLDDFHQSIYLWKPEYYYLTNGDVNLNWTSPYKIIAISNSILDELPNVRNEMGLSRNTIKGSALFHRAFAYLNLALIYCQTYDEKTAAQELGLPLRLTPDINEKTKRATLEETYTAIEKDLLESVELLPDFSEVQTRPNKVSAHAVISRLYLFMGKYEKALYHANFALSINNFLIDYNEINQTSSVPFQRFNNESLFYAFVTSGILLPSRECYVDTLLYNSYHEDDLRKLLFFRSENNGYHSFKGSYTGNSNGVGSLIGPTVSELYLIRSECHARLGQATQALDALNHLLSNRYKRGKFKPLLNSNTQEVLSIVLLERRKELIFRGMRWADLKRLNRDAKFAKTLIRKVPGYEEVHELPPNDLRYVFLIPQRVIEMTGIEQNPR